MLHQSLPNLLSWLRSHGVKSERSLGLLLSQTHRRLFPKRTTLVEEGVCCANAFLVEKGMTRSYWIVDGEEITTSFSTEGSIVFSMDELYYDRPSEEFVEAVENVEAYAIPLPFLRKIVMEDRELAGWWIKIHQDEYRRLHRSHKERLTLSAAERYNQFRCQFPEVCRRARLIDIASYLGITPSTLSKIRSAR